MFLLHTFNINLLQDRCLFYITFFTMQNNYVINYRNLTVLPNLQNKYASMYVQPSKFTFLNIILQNFFRSYMHEYLSTS